jgi:RimJ/RimL family protein N-acetyltransferase
VRSETARLLFRPLGRDDIDAISELMSDPEVCRYTIAGPWTREEAAAFLAKVDPPRDGHEEFAVIERATGELIGHVGCEPYGPGQTEVGWMLRRDRWGLGYGTEAAREIVAHAAATPGITEVVARCNTGNAASAAIMRKIGMTFVGIIEGDVIEGVVRDSMLFSTAATS